MKDGVPIALGYFAVSFTFGMMAVAGGLRIWQAVLISLTNLTSAGQFAGLDIIFAGGSMWEMAMTQLIINLRYCLMSFSLSQKFRREESGILKYIAAFGITDEIFGISAAQEGKVSNYGAMCVAIPGWTLGTLAGGISGSLLPDFMLSALSVAIYGMFLAIIIPPSKKSRPVLGVVAASMAVSTVFAVTPVLKQVSSGFMIIITTLLIAGLAAGDGNCHLSHPYAAPCSCKKRDQKPVYQVLSVLCAICLSGSHDLPGHPEGHRQHHLRCSRFPGSTYCCI